VLVDEFGVAVDELDAHLLEALRVVVGLCDLLLHGVNALPHVAPVDRGLDGLDSEVVGGAHVVRRLRRGQQRLARHAAGPQAIAADAAALRHRDLEVESGGELGRHHPPGTHPDDHEVVPVCHLDPPGRACGA
jgi:hypothetical protein